MKLDHTKALIDKAHSIAQIVRIAMQAEYSCPGNMSRIRYREQISEHAALKIKELFK